MLLKNDGIGFYRRSSTKQKHARLKAPSFHLAIKIRALSRYTSKEIIKRSLPRAYFIKPHSRQRYRRQHQVIPVRAGLILCFTLPIHFRQLWQGRLTLNRSHNTIKKSRTIRLQAGNACSPKTST